MYSNNSLTSRVRQYFYFCNCKHRDNVILVPLSLKSEKACFDQKVLDYNHSNHFGMFTAFSDLKKKKKVFSFLHILGNEMNGMQSCIRNTKTGRLAVVRKKQQLFGSSIQKTHRKTLLSLLTFVFSNK